MNAWAKTNTRTNTWIDESMRQRKSPLAHGLTYKILCSPLKNNLLECSQISEGVRLKSWVSGMRLFKLKLFCLIIPKTYPSGWLVQPEKRKLEVHEMDRWMANTYACARCLRLYVLRAWGYGPSRVAVLALAAIHSPYSHALLRGGRENTGRPWWQF